MALMAEESVWVGRLALMAEETVWVGRVARSVEATLNSGASDAAEAGCVLVPRSASGLDRSGTRVEDAAAALLPGKVVEATAAGAG